MWCLKKAAQKLRVKLIVLLFFKKKKNKLLYGNGDEIWTHHILMVDQPYKMGHIVISNIFVEGQIILLGPGANMLLGRFPLPSLDRVMCQWFVSKTGLGKTT